MATKSRNDQRLKRHQRVRNSISGTSERPRLNVFRSLSQIYAQLIDDTAGHTLVAASSLERSLQKKSDKLNKIDQAVLVGEELAKRARQAGIKQVVFDRGGFRFSGRVKALADGARKGGLEF